LFTCSQGFAGVADDDLPALIRPLLQVCFFSCADKLQPLLPEGQAPRPLTPPLEMILADDNHISCQGLTSHSLQHMSPCLYHIKNYPNFHSQVASALFGKPVFFCRRIIAWNFLVKYLKLYIKSTNKVYSSKGQIEKIQ